MTDRSTNAPKVVVIGGGYAGTLAANRLLMRTDVDITLVNPRPKFVERVRLHQLVAGTGDPNIDYGTLLGEGIDLVVDTAIRIDTASRQVQFASRRALNYDYVIYAVGSTGTTSSSVLGAAECAYPIGELEPAQQLRTKLNELHSDAAVTVVGAGLTGIETAAELAEQGRTVTLVCGGQLAPSLSERGRRSIAKWLAKHGVAVLKANTVAEVGPDAVVFTDGTVRPSLLTIWTGGFGVPQLAVNSGLTTDAVGRLLTDETLTSVDNERIVAAGDAAAPSGQPLRMCCQAALPLGAQAANTVLSRMAGTEPAMLNQRFSGACISLGRRAGRFQFTRKDDTPVNFYIGGRVATTSKEYICKTALKYIATEGRKPGAYSWIKGGERPYPVIDPMPRV